MAGLGGVFGEGSAARQLLIWNVAGQLIAALMTPVITQITQDVNALDPQTETSPADLAEAVLRNVIALDNGRQRARAAGLDAGKFDELVAITGNAPPPEALVEALRRQLIPEAGAGPDAVSFEQGIRETRLKDKYIPLMRALAVELPTWADALDAKLKGQLPDDEALAWFEKAGGDPAAFTWLYDTKGASPTPDMLGTLANRGIIPWDGLGPLVTSFEQGFKEGQWRNKWAEPMRALQRHIPPARSVVALLRSGAITEARALTLLKDYGMSVEDAAAYIKEATATHAARAKELSRTDIETMLTDHVITATQATDMLKSIGYTAANAALLTTQVGVRRAIANTNNAITRIRTLYVGHRLASDDASQALTALGVDKVSAGELLATWDIEHAANLRPLTPAQVTDAWHKSIMSDAEATDELVTMGYTAYDAWVLLSLKNGSALPNKPART